MLNEWVEWVREEGIREETGPSIHAGDQKKNKDPLDLELFPSTVWGAVDPIHLIQIIYYI